MNPITLADLANATPTTAQRFITSLADDDELYGLAFDLLQLYSFACRRLTSDFGYMATMAALHEIVERSDDWPLKHAAQLVLAHQQVIPAPSTTGDPDGDRVPVSLCAEGAHQLEQKWHVLGVVSARVAAISALPVLWRSLLPQLATSAGQDILQRFAAEEIDDVFDW
jgi:hypothetical protein